jgi:putative membrane protein
MADEKKDPEAIKKIKPVPPSRDLDREEPTETQKKIEEEVARLEQENEATELSTEFSRNRTHMSEHRTRMSEHRTDLSEHRTELSELRSELSKHRTELSEHRSALSLERTGLSYQRTALSYERTLMSWVRTAVSLITFGFTLYKFFEEWQKTSSHPGFFTPRVVGLIMIGFGVIGLLFAEIQHIFAYRRLKKECPELQVSLSSVLGALILTMGLLLFFVALFRQ